MSLQPQRICFSDYGLTAFAAITGYHFAPPYKVGFKTCFEGGDDPEILTLR